MIIETRREYSVENTRNLKEGIGYLFDACVNTMGWRPYCLSRMEVSYCTFGFGAITHPHDNQYVCVICVHAGKATHA